ncbi:MAG: hypothetical protein R2710_01935 [Acidimicrobiales bacterium]
MEDEIVEDVTVDDDIDSASYHDHEFDDGFDEAEALSTTTTPDSVTAPPTTPARPRSSARSTVAAPEILRWTTRRGRDRRRGADDASRVRVDREHRASSTMTCSTIFHTMSTTRWRTMR